MFIFKRLVKNEIIYKEPIPGKMPPIWIRMLLWTTCGLVSFFHGQNDGQKGVGLVMMILIAILPASFSLDADVNLQSTNANVMLINKVISTTDTTQFGKEEFKNYNTIKKHADHFNEATSGKAFAEAVALTDRFELRKDIVKITKSAEKLIKSPNVAISKNDLNALKSEIKEAKKLVEYAPSWVIIMISVSLGLGTMIGWKRIVKTIGEKIGKQHMSYAQGASAEIVASMGIGVASAYGVPVSTTHMLSSGIMGSMVAKKGLKNLQRKTITNIFMAWILTLPVTMILSGGLFLLFRAIL
jgi:PiT family inorganic phosphate transporter